jgi:acetate kinase
MYLLAINCGSSSIKGKLYPLPPSKDEQLKPTANLSVSNISSKGENVKIKIKFEGEHGKDLEEEGEDGGEVDCELQPSIYSLHQSWDQR